MLLLYIYLSVVGTDWTTASKRAVRITFLGVWERVVFDLIIPGLYMRSRWTVSGVNIKKSIISNSLNWIDWTNAIYSQTLVDMYTTVQNVWVDKKKKKFLRSKMLTKAAIMWSKYSKYSNILKYIFLQLNTTVLYFNVF